MSNLLCIGGPYDGCWFAHLPGQPPFLRAPVEPGDAMSVEDGAHITPDGIPMCTYRLMTIRAFNGAIDIWAPVRMSDEALLRRLIGRSDAQTLRQLMLMYRPNADVEVTMKEDTTDGPAA